MIIPIILNLSGGRVLSVIPEIGLSSGKEYELNLYGFTNDAGKEYPVNSTDYIQVCNLWRCFCT